MYVKLTNGVPANYTVEDLRRDNPQVSFPKDIPDRTLAEHDVHPLVATPRPSVDHTKTVTEARPALIGGAWTQVWAVADASAAELAERTQQASDDVRFERNRLLADSDWTQVADAPVNKTAWAGYRQELRDITDQPGFPHNVTWPTQP